MLYLCYANAVFSYRNCHFYCLWGSGRMSSLNAEKHFSIDSLKLGLGPLVYIHLVKLRYKTHLCDRFRKRPQTLVYWLKLLLWPYSTRDLYAFLPTFQKSVLSGCLNMSSHTVESSLQAPKKWLFSKQQHYVIEEMRLALPSADTLSCTITCYLPRKKQDLDSNQP